ncbi:MAG: hypothetical protein U0X41_07985 [Chitinophagales bacterium]
MDILLKPEFEDVLWNVDAKVLIIKILFELKRLEPIAFHLKSLKMYLYRQKHIGYFKAIHQKTIHHFGLLYKNMDSSKTKKGQLKRLIAAEKDLVEKEWFLEILEKV